MPAKLEKEQDGYVEEILDSAKKAAGYIRGLSFGQFWDDYKTRDAVAMRLHVIGEAAKHVTAATAAKLPAVPWVDIRGMRNRIAHDYGGVNFRIVWKTAHDDLPPLVSELEKYLRHQRQALQPPPPAQKVQPQQSLGILRPPSPGERPGPRMGI